MSSGPPSFAGLRRAADQIKGSQLPSHSTATTSLSKHIPASFTWEDLARELAPLDDQGNTARVLALKACLDADPSRLEASEGERRQEEEDARRQIRQFVAGVFSPIVVREDGDDDDLRHGDDLAGRREAAVRRCKAYSSSGIAVLERVGLPRMKSPQGKVHEAIEGDDAQVLYTLTALADAGQPWTTDAAAARAARLLAGAFTHGDPDSGTSRAAKSLWIVDGILKQYLRPLFARSRPATVTESGRKTEFVSGGGGAAMTDIASAESPRNKPWKYVDLRAISVFAWAVHEADGELIRGNWPLFIPVLLALIDDPDTTVRARGLVLLKTFAEAVPRQGGADGDASLLHATGLDSVLADAIFPTLLFLPRLTPEKESLQLLGPAYQALLSLASTATAARKDKPLSKPAADLLDRVLRDGIYTGYFHANEHIRIVEELVRQAGYIVQAMGVYAVKHLKDLMPLYGGIMTDPFAMRYIPAVAAAVDALQTTIATCWPRLANAPWQEETLQMLMLCWLNADEDTSGGADEKRHRADLQARLVKTADTQLAVMRAAKVDLDAAVGPLIAKEPRLKALFRL